MGEKMSNAEILCFVLGWQGGTVHQVAEALDVSVDLILEADIDTLRALCRGAQLAAK